MILRAFLIAALLPAVAFARDVTDATGRTVSVPDKPERVFAAGPPAATLLYTLKPEAVVGWARYPRAEDLPYLPPTIHDLPELGRLTGYRTTCTLLTRR